jgi:AAA family ATP:ADP antiporter
LTQADAAHVSPRASGLLVCSLALVVLFGHAIARPAIESLFLEAHGARGLPTVWIAVAVTALLTVAGYNAAAARYPLGQVMVGAVLVSLATLAVLVVILGTGWRLSAFCLYVWKDVHIVVLLEALWSFANLVFKQQTARWAYGMFCAAGSVGGISGNLVVGKLALAWSTEATLWLLVPLFIVQVGLVAWLAKAAGQPQPQSQSAKGEGSSFALLRNSPYLAWLLVLVGLVQVAITLIDYTYNDAIALAYPDTDARTVVIGRVYATIDGTALALQLATGVVLRGLGLRVTLIGIPALLGLVVVSFTMAPRFALMAITKVASKVFDYSLFRAAKEMLYLPLSYGEKTRGKALIDMLTYRVAKGGASLLVAGMLALGIANGVQWVTVALIVAWIAVTIVVTQRHRRLTEDCPTEPS